jgi:hypothetical protein
MRSLTAVFVVSTGLIAFAQSPVVVQNSNNPPATPPANTYLLTPPNVALPGSGTATGAPVPQGTNVNDSRNTQGGSVFQPATVGGTAVVDSYRVSTPNTTVEGTSQANGAIAETSSESITGDGMRNFSSGAPGAMANSKSLADIAAEVRGNKPGIGKRSFDNSDIAALSNTVGNQPIELPESDEAGLTSSNAHGPYTTPSGEEVLDRADYAAVQAALARSSQQQNPDQTTEVAQNQQPQDVNAQQQAGAADRDRQTVEQKQPEVNTSTETEQQADTLPQTSSALPLLGLLGVGAVTFGMVFRNARRTF